MDTNEMIAGLVRELSDARKELGLAHHDLGVNIARWRNTVNSLCRLTESASWDARHAYRLALDLSADVDPANLTEAKELLIKIDRLPRRISEIRASLSVAGIDL